MMRALTAVALVVGSVAAPAGAQIVINEFNSGTPDFIELRNVSSGPVDVSGWIVASWYSDSSATPTAEPVFQIPPGTVIPGFGFLVLQEFGTAGQPGTLPNSMYVGFNYFWIDSRTIEIALYDNHKVGVDYVYQNWYGGAQAPHLPAGLKWTGTLGPQSGKGDEVRRVTDIDTDDASDWTKSPGSGTPGEKNPGQQDCILLTTYGEPCPGFLGDHPQIATYDCPSAGEQFSLYIHGGVGGSMAYVLIGLEEGDTPIFGGECSLRVEPLLPFFLPVPLGGSGAGGGSAIVTGYFPPGSDGSSVTLQVFNENAGATSGYTASTGVRLTVP